MLRLMMQLLLVWKFLRNETPYLITVITAVYLSIIPNGLFAETNQLTNCAELLKKPQLLGPDFFRSKEWRDLSPSAPDKFKIAYAVAQEGLLHFSGQYSNADGLIQTIATGIVSRDFVFLAGAPGGAKTKLAREIFEAEIASYPEAEKKVFTIQFHKLVSEGAITGFEKISSRLKYGLRDIETADALVGDRFIFGIFDEMEKANPATLASFLSVLNERKAFLGDRVVETILMAGVATSNKNFLEFIKSFEQDRPTGEALLDRFLLKFIVANQNLSDEEDVQLLRKLYLAKDKERKPVLSLHHLTPLLDKIKIPDEVLWNIVNLTTGLDSTFIGMADQTLRDIIEGREDASEYLPASQFSIRTVKRQVRMLKARFLVAQVMEQIPFDALRLKVENFDLLHLAAPAIYGGPGEIRATRLQYTGSVRGDFGAVLPNITIEIDPYSGIVYAPPLSGSSKKRVFKIDLQTMKFFDNGVLPLEEDKKKIVEKLKSFDRELVKFEDDGRLSKYLVQEMVDDAQKEDLKTVQKERGHFLSQLNALMAAERENKKKGIEPAYPKTGIVKKGFNISAADRLARLEELNQKSDLTHQEKLELSWISSQLAYKSLSEHFIEADHYIKALFNGILSQSNVYAFGPPGAAKTAIADAVLGSEVQSMNKRIRKILDKAGIDQNHKPVTDEEKAIEEEKLKKLISDIHNDQIKASKDVKKYLARHAKKLERFFLQFHKLLPEGVITGFKKLQDQIDHGKADWESYSSMVHCRFMVALLDEAEKSNPAVLNSLLSVINEKEAFLGSEVVKACIQTAVMTSNKTVHEFLVGMGDDRKAGEALLDRALHKVFVFNKFSDRSVLFQFLKDQEEGRASKIDLMADVSLTPLIELVEQVKIPGESDEAPGELLLLSVSARRSFLKRQIPLAKKSVDAHLADPIVNPNVYIPATSKASNRSLVQLMMQCFKASFILNQLFNGTPFNKIRLEMRPQDLRFLSQGLAYWGPYSTEETEVDGVVQYQLSTQIDQYVNSPVIRTRDKFVMENIRDEMKAFLEILNDNLRQFAFNQRSFIAQNRNLYPGLIKNESAFAAKYGVTFSGAAPPPGSASASATPDASAAASGGGGILDKLKNLTGFGK